MESAEPDFRSRRREEAGTLESGDRKAECGKIDADRHPFRIPHSAFRASSSPPPHVGGYEAAPADIAPAENIIPLASTDRLASLRAMLAERFPEASPPPRATLPTGLASLDAPEGGLRRGALSELSGSTAAGALFVETMLLTAARERCFLALVDGARTFDPQGCEHGLLERLLWVLCADALQAVKAADLLLRDGNLPLVLLDLQFLPARALRKIPPSTWHRFGRLVEQTGTTFVVLSPRPMVEAASVRIAIRNHWRLDSMRALRGELLDGIDAQIFPRRQHVTNARAQRSA
jgi:hypothetical protein